MNMRQNESETKYRNIFEAAHDIILETDRDGNILEINHQAEVLLGYTQVELRQMNVYQHLHIPEDRAFMHTIMEDIVAGKMREYEVRWQAKDGRILHFEGSSVPNFSADGLFISAIRCLHDVTERKRLEVQLHESEALNGLILSNISDAVFVTDEAGYFTYVCPSAAVLFGYSSEEMLAKNHIAHFLGEDVTGRLDGSDGTEIINIEHTIIDKIGNVHQVLSSIKRVAIGGGTRLYTVHDITDRKQAEASLRHSEALFSGIFQAVPAAIDISTIRNGQIVNVNPHFLELTGYEADDVLGKTVDEIGLWSPMNERDAFIQAMQDQGHVYRRESHWKTKSGKILDVMASMAPITIDGEACVLVIAADNTIHKRAEEILHRGEVLFSTIFQSVPLGISIHRAADQQIMNVNPTLLELCGYNADELIGLPYWQIPAWARGNQAEQFNQAMSESGEISNLEFEWLRKDGKPLDILVSAIQVELHDEPCILTIALDISERKRVEQSRMELYKEREVLELKEHFISKMSHEFRTPLSVILASTDGLLHYSDRMTSERRAEKLTHIADQVLYINKMMDEVLTLSKARSGKLKFNPSMMNLVDYCKSIFEELQSIERVQHNYVFEALGDLGACMVDRELLQHILVNLLSNAIKYSPTGGHVVLELQRDQNTAIIKIDDEGIGIPVEDQKHLFEPFYRASNTGKIKGTGLGLAIVKESVEAHGGTVTCESIIGKGTTFIIRLPILGVNQPAVA